MNDTEKIKLITKLIDETNVDNELESVETQTMTANEYEEFIAKSMECLFNIVMVLRDLPLQKLSKSG